MLVTPQAPAPRAWSRIQPFLLAAVFILALIKFGSVVHDHYPIHRWLFWRYARAGVVAFVWMTACLVAGHAIQRRVLPHVLPVLEQLVLSFGFGFFAFILLMTGSGLLHLYGPVLFLGLPLLMIAAGARDALGYGRRLARHLRAARSRAAPRQRWWSLPLLSFAVLGTTAVYLPVLIPENASFDSCWYHLPIAEHYVAAGGIVSFREGWHLGAFPHLASILYTWAFLQPWATLFDRVELCAHLEVVVFLWTLASVPLLVRKLIPRTRASWSFVVMYLFPGLFLYDSSLVAGADHIAAFWAVPIFVAMLRTWKDFDVRWAAITGVFIAAALDTKYTAFCLAVGPIAALVARGLYLSIAAFRKRVELTPRSVLAGLGAFALSGVIMTAPHWAKNLAFYGDPLYPALWRHLPVHPWTADSPLRYAPDNWVPTRDLAGVWQSVTALWTFSFVPNDWETFHRNVPVFGSLFTLTLIALPLLRGTRRLWGLAAITLAGVLAWYWVNHQDRYLQALLPWMAAFTAAMIVLVWRSGWLARVAIAPLVALQILWGMAVYFIPSHSMLLHHPLRALTELGGAWFRKDGGGREWFLHASSAGKLLRKESDVVLVHEKRKHLGLMARSVSDHPRFQSGISYARLGSPREIWELYHRLGVTHVLFADSSDGTDSYTGDLVFWDFALRYTHSNKDVGGLTLASMPALPPPADPFGDAVALFVCRSDLANGLYHLPELNLYPLDTNPAGGFPCPFERASSASDIDRHISRAAFLIHDGTCHSRLPQVVSTEFVPLTRRGPERLYVRKTSP